MRRSIVYVFVLALAVQLPFGPYTLEDKLLFEPLLAATFAVVAGPFVWLFERRGAAKDAAAGAGDWTDCSVRSEAATGGRWKLGRLRVAGDVVECVSRFGRRTFVSAPLADVTLRNVGEVDPREALHVNPACRLLTVGTGSATYELALLPESADRFVAVLTPRGAG